MTAADARSAKLLAATFLALAAITTGIAADASGPPSVLRHLYLVPTVWVALSRGARVGALTGLIAGLVQAPFALPAIERLGLAAATIDGLLSMVMPIAVGWMTGRLGDQLRGRETRLRAVLFLQRILSHDLPLEERLQVAAEAIRNALGVERVGLVIEWSTDARIVVSAPYGLIFDPTSAAAWVLRTGRPVFADDLSRDPRFGQAWVDVATPVRGLVLPLDSGGESIGVLAVERAGDLPAPIRVAAREMALHLALAVDNAKLTLRQRRFTEELEEKVAVATDRLRELDQAKSEFVSVVAHELRTPLTALQGFSELLLSRPVPPERAARFLCHLHNEAQRLGRIVSELLDLSRIESGRSLELDRQPIDVAELFECNVELFATQHRGHHFEWASSLGSATVRADRDAVDRMLKNLMSNAVKYSPGGGSVAVTARVADEHPDMVEITVEDSGVGIPPAALSRIFDKYARLSNPATTGVRGLGLGLTLVRAIAEAHGGRVEVESLPGKGSKFRVFLPA